MVSKEKSLHLFTPESRRPAVISKVRPLFLRGAIPSEIVMIAGFTWEQVVNALERKSKRTGLHNIGEEFFTKDKISERLIKARLNKPKSLVNRPPISEEERKSIEFGKRLNESGLIGKDLSDWHVLHAFYKRYNRQLPDSFYDKLRLEVFLVCRKQAENGNREGLEKYISWGEEVDKDWFMNSLIDEQKFITTALGKQTAVGYSPDEGSRFVRAEEFFEAAGTNWPEG